MSIAYARDPVLTWAGIARVAYTVVRAYTLATGGPEPIAAWDDLHASDQDDVMTKVTRIMASPFATAEELHLADDPKAALMFYEAVRALS